MRRTTLTVTAAAALATALSFGAAYATHAGSDGGDTPVVNKNGHPVDEHAAKGQARAAEVHARNAAKQATKHPEATDSPTASETPTETATAVPDEDAVDPNEHAGTHPDTHALPGGTDHGQDGEEHGGQARGQGDHGPDEHAGDRPDAHASRAPTAS